VHQLLKRLHRRLALASAAQAMEVDQQFAIGDKVQHWSSKRVGEIIHFGSEDHPGRVCIQWADRVPGYTEWRWLAPMVSWGALAFRAALSVGT